MARVIDPGTDTQDPAATHPGMHWDPIQGWVPDDPTQTYGDPTQPWRMVDPGTAGPTAPLPPTTPRPSSTVGALLSPGAMPTIPSGTDFLPKLPVFTPPPYTPPPAYASPTGESVLNEPGYQFRLGEGERALEQSAAARGVLNTGGTLKNILGYGQNFASGEYTQADNRQRSNYATNYASQYLDPYAIAYKGAADAFAPQMTGYTTTASAAQHASDLGYQNAYEQYLQKFRERQQLFDNTFRTVTA